MIVNETAPASPGFIDRIRDLIAKVFGRPARVPKDAEPVLAADAPKTAPPTGTTMRAIATGPRNATA